MALEPTEETEPEFSIDIGRLADMSAAQTRVLRSVASALGFTDMRKFRAYLSDIDATYYDMLRLLYGD